MLRGAGKMQPATFLRDSYAQGSLGASAYGQSPRQGSQADGPVEHEQRKPRRLYGATPFKRDVQRAISSSSASIAGIKAAVFVVQLLSRV